MKKLIFLLSLIAVAAISIAQTRVAEITPDGYITKPAYVYVWGTSADTLTDADTISYVLRIRGDRTQDFSVQIYNEFVSGTATGKLKSYKSIDGITWVVTAAADSITVAAVTADILDSEVLSYGDYLSPYLKFTYIQAGTGVNIPRVYIYSKEN